MTYPFLSAYGCPLANSFKYPLACLLTPPFQLEGPRSCASSLRAQDREQQTTWDFLFVNTVEQTGQTLGSSGLATLGIAVLRWWTPTEYHVVALQIKA